MKFSAPIELVHNPSPGRLRAKVFAIYRSEEAKDALEKKLSQFNYVESVKANSLTGSVLILFDANRTATAEVLAALESLYGPIKTPTSAKAPLATTAKRQSPLKHWLQALALNRQTEEVKPASAKAKPGKNKSANYALNAARQTPPQ